MQSIGGVLDSRATLKNNVNNVKSINTNNVNNVINHRKVEETAQKLVHKFNSPQSYKFFCFVAYKLPESIIWQNYESAVKGKNPPALFNWLCRKAIQ